MDEFLGVLVSLLAALIGFVAAFLLFYLRDIRLYSKRTKEQRRRGIVQRQLEKLYSPLFFLIKYHEFIVPGREPGLTYIADPISFSPEGIPESRVSKGKRDLDSIILNYGYLAEDELMGLLPRLVGAGFYDKRNAETVPRMVELILSGYERLRKEYYAT
jgi:hypothetical protein